ncbi:uncharacterized protein SOCE26_083070 [Sorangium cellulosum]|uniref:Aminoglycoside phosphotransferase domain-containing protein n=1 Tax=Sorangium cellulosum TaxID=56 RepID=A0A2L0F5C7_SORCE|nr:uncharacterized protein SOCE26_083070 [Sorangium cellulosum]
MERLDGAATGGGEGRRLADAILDAWRTWQGRLELPLRHSHGDLKISNLRFSEAGEEICVLDLDTLELQPIDVELGEAWRSWCNPVGEDATEARFDLEVFAAAVAGYREVRPFGAEEREALADAVERIALELEARFCRDVFEDRYFGWNPARFAHNLQRAAGQLALARSARRQRGEIARLLAGGEGRRCAGAALPAAGGQSGTWAGAWLGRAADGLAGPGWGPARARWLPDRQKPRAASLASRRTRGVPAAWGAMGYRCYVARSRSRCQSSPRRSRACHPPSRSQPQPSRDHGPSGSRLCGEDAAAVVEQNAHGGAIVVRDGEVGLAIAIQVCGRNRIGGITSG